MTTFRMCDDNGPFPTNQVQAQTLPSAPAEFRAADQADAIAGEEPKNAPVIATNGRGLPVHDGLDRRQVEGVLAELATRMHVRVPVVSWTNRKRGRYTPWHQMVELGPRVWRGWNTVLHEFAHHVQHARGLGDAPRAGGGWRRPAIRHHGPNFTKVLREVVGVALENVAQYAWTTEYATVQRDMGIRKPRRPRWVRPNGLLVPGFPMVIDFTPRPKPILPVELQNVVPVAAQAARIDDGERSLCPKCGAIRLASGRCRPCHLARCAAWHAAKRNAARPEATVAPVVGAVDFEAKP